MLTVAIVDVHIPWDLHVVHSLYLFSNVNIYNVNVPVFVPVLTFDSEASLTHASWRENCGLPQVHMASI